MDESGDTATMTSQDATQSTRPPSRSSRTSNSAQEHSEEVNEVPQCDALVVYEDAHNIKEEDETRVCDYVAPRLDAQERMALRAEAQREYHGRVFRVLLADLHREERIARDAVEDSAAFTFEALRRWLRETCAQDITTTSAAEALARLLRLLQRRASRDAATAAERERRLCEDGRAAWKAEVAAQAEARRREKEEELIRKRDYDRLCRALTFISVQEKSDRAALEETALRAYHSVAVHELAERELARQMAMENFLKSPEQMALAAEQERQQARERKRIAREARLHRAQQERFVNNCHHGRGGNSLFAGPAPQKVCGKCRVRFDDTLGYYVSMDEPKGNNNTTSTSSGPRRSLVSTAESRPRHNSILTPLPSTPAAAGGAKGRKTSMGAMTKDDVKQTTAATKKKGSLVTAAAASKTPTLPALTKPTEAAAAATSTAEATEDTSAATPAAVVQTKKDSRTVATRGRAQKTSTEALPAVRTRVK